MEILAILLGGLLGALLFQVLLIIYFGIVILFEKAFPQKKEPYEPIKPRVYLGRSVNCINK